MAETLSYKMSAGGAWNFRDNLAIGPSVQNNSFSYTQDLANGTGANQADKWYAAVVTLPPLGAVPFDLAGGLTDVYGTGITMARVRSVYLEHRTTTASASVLLGGGSNPVPLFEAAGDRVRVRNGGAFALHSVDATGYPVTAGSADTIWVENESASASATIRFSVAGVSV